MLYSYRVCVSNTVNVNTLTQNVSSKREYVALLHFIECVTFVLPCGESLSLLFQRSIKHFFAKPRSH